MQLIMLMKFILWSYGYQDGIILYTNFLSDKKNEAFISGSCYFYNENESGIVYIGGAKTFRCEEVEVFKVIINK